MSNIIKLLPDAIANQIAAGEVIQRPASAVKELLENAIDAGAKNIKLIVKDAGKGLIQVLDDGSGMSEMDARLCFDRHATSKIRQAADLFAIKTMGFRGEALASIAAVAQVEMRTRQQEVELGTRIVIEDSIVKVQEPCQCSVGSNFSIKNLFYNVPARRNFLKTDAVEMRHIIDEFQRVALAYPEVFFSLHHNGAELFHLPAGNLRQRLVAVFGSNYNKHLVPVSEETDTVNLYGFVGKPEAAKKSRGDQYFFVNNRFIKSGYLHHAVTSAFEGLIPTESFPFYVLFIEIDPSRIDVNVHPTKQEIKFDDERIVYNYLKVAVRHALGQYSITPTLDFEQELGLKTGGPVGQRPHSPVVNLDDLWSGSRPSTAGSGSNTASGDNSNLRNWRKLYEGLDAFDLPDKETEQQQQLFQSESMTIESQWNNEETDTPERVEILLNQRKEPYQLHQTYIVTQIKSGFLLIDQQSCHERILYERYLKVLQEQEATVQQELFPKTLTFPPADMELLREILPEINQLGFDIQEFGGGTFILHGGPADWGEVPRNEQQIIELLLEQYRKNIDLKLDLRENIARSMATGAAIKRNQPLSPIEMQELIDQLFACETPMKSPSGKPTFITFETEELRKKFQ